MYFHLHHKFILPSPPQKKHVQICEIKKLCHSLPKLKQLNVLTVNLIVAENILNSRHQVISKMSGKVISLPQFFLKDLP